MRPKRLQMPEDRVDLTPMIDVVFLLLVFFMVTTTIVKQEADLGVQLPSSTAAAADTPLPEQQYIDILADGTVLLNGSPMDAPSDRNLPNLTQTLKQIKASADRAGLKTLALVNPDPDTTQQHLVNVLNALKEAEIQSVSFGS